MRIKFSSMLLALLPTVFIPVILANTDSQGNEISYSVNKIAFVSKRDGNSEIYTINDDGTDLKRLTNGKDEDLQPQWSPDGGKILYLSKNKNKCALRVMNSDGSGQVELTGNCAGEYLPSWSPDGSKILFVGKSKAKNAIYTVDADGNNLNCLTELGIEGAYPSWSPDGSKILCCQSFHDETYLYTMNPNGTEQLKLIREKGVYQAPTWSPDGRKIAYISTKKTLLGTFNQIFVMNSDGGNSLDIVTGSKRVEDINYNDDFFWSPDGTKIAFTKVAEIEGHVSKSGSVTYTYIYGTYIVSTDGNGHEQQLDKTGAVRALPGWAPDSSKIAYLCNSGLKIYNMKTKIDSEIRVNVSIPLSPVRWSPDGTKLIFAGKNSSFQKSGLYLVTLDGKVVKLSEANDYDPVWAPAWKE